MAENKMSSLNKVSDIIEVRDIFGEMSPVTQRELSVFFIKFRHWIRS